jgi:hypothetical protein
MSETPISSEDDGIPDYADDESSAYDTGDRPSFEDSPAALPGEDPAVLPPEVVSPEEEADLSEQPPIASSTEESMESESEIGVTGDGDGGVVVDAEPADTNVATTSLDRPAEDADVTAEDAGVTLYDVNEPGDPVGRLVEAPSEPEAGADSDETQGLTPEESAMHTVDDPGAA